jgi:hypothetical protein
MKTPAKVTAPKVPAVNCRNKTEEQCRKISETLKDAYQKGRRFRKVGFSVPKEKAK